MATQNHAIPDVDLSAPAPAPPPVINSTDATIGQSLRTRVEARRAELEAALEDSALDARARGDIEHALGAVEQLMTGDLDNIPQVVGTALNKWLETNKHLNERPVVATVAPESEPETAEA